MIVNVLLILLSWFMAGYWVARFRSARQMLLISKQVGDIWRQLDDYRKGCDADG